ncbi:FtsK/SpoIIIE domain-containing protein [Bythopirellula goksoeyrii]|uniref:FtsK-like domain-containing protein n=1 Tax=Bythopirellula goksoeyrii TaxID=1400387 RepID=A0A5B9Q631_9BACT|nr:FtsK/SpoIIIE domain-containing protein [Bythopirellula goksoeyrii]QEG32985.1 FtsK-like domain-containing protein [Bythopirellula goksoeyrii]
MRKLTGRLSVAHVTKQRLSTRRQLELMQQLQQLANTRAAEEARLAASLSEILAAAEKDHTLNANRLTKTFTERRRDLENEFSNAKLAVGQQYRETKAELTSKSESEINRIEVDYKQLLLGIERTHKEKQWEAMAVFDASKDKPQQLLDQAGKRIQSRKSQVDSLLRDADTLLTMRRLDKHIREVEENTLDSSVETVPVGGGEDRQQATLAELHRAVLALQAQKLPSLLFEENRFIIWGLLATLILFVPALIVSSSLLISALVAPVLGALATGVLYLILGPRAKRATLDEYDRIHSLVTDSRRHEIQARQEAQLLSRQEADAITTRKQEGLDAAQVARQQAVAEGEARKQKLLVESQSRFKGKLAELEAQFQSTQAAAMEKYPPLLDQLAEERQIAWQENEASFEKRTSDAQSEHDSSWQAMADQWFTGFQQIADELDQMQASCDQFFPNWSTIDWEDWQRPDRLPPVISFGKCLLPLQAVKNGLSEDARLVPERTELNLPAWMSFAESPRLMITADGAGRRVAVEALQLLMLRFLTAAPAGKLRFTICDPAGLGENFATFMHLADYDEQLVGKRILTDSRQIDERLSLLSDHMEKVFQKYLRNEFESIHEYNAHAGEVAEPFHVIVVANFPAGLSDASIRKLKTIAATGPRCGVYTILSADSSLKLPADISMEEMLADAVHLDWVDDRLRWRYPLFEKLTLELDKLPPKEKLNEILRHAGEESHTASRVEVPFEVVAPSPEQVWVGNAAQELVVPIGRAGANELQSLRLGKGTAQHALISGKTGSGKSTLLHALVTNLALHYSPREVEFYLVDFKKGVEFKTYATHELPHARVIAIESEREFGVSVLERLDDELRSRGERFRELGVQDLAGFRRESGEDLSRLLLVIDEFQELFVSDDKLAQDAALLLDRLVRQGRAFGIHVLLGSQTLAGAYSLARSTIGQMAVRIALECSEADAHLILSDDNSAARLLSRPGEAIYNDQNGMVEGNHLFQVVWLADSQRQQYLADIRQRQLDAGIATVPAIVFEGNVPANPLSNEQLVDLITSDSDGPVVEPKIWLGSAVRIEPPTQLTFRRQGGNHLLIVGQDEPLALGILSTAVATLASQQQGDESKITILDGMRSESLDRGAWQKVIDAMPDRVRICPVRETSHVISQLADEVSRRNSDPVQEYEPQFLVIYDLAQFRDLRVTEEEFTFAVSSSNNGKPPATDKQFREILREGPAVGIHLLIWCDSHNSLARILDRIALREVDYRVALQMSPVDSTSLIDSPAAGRLGEHRAIFYRDDLGTSVKFRPYGRPSDEWLAWLAEQSAVRRVGRP